MTKLILSTLVAIVLYLAILSSAMAETWKVDENLSIDFVPNNQSQRFCLTFKLANNWEGYVGLAFDKNLYPADTVVMWLDPNNNEPKIWDAFNPGIAGLASFPSALNDINPQRNAMMPNYGKQNYTNIGKKVKKGVIMLTCCRAYYTGDPFDFRVREGINFKVHAFYNMNEVWIESSNYKQAAAISGNGSGPFVKVFTTKGNKPGN